VLTPLQETKIYRRRGGSTTVICTSHARYGDQKALDGMPHIRRVTPCTFPQDDNIKVGDVLSLGAIYNSTDHMLMQGHKGGRLEPVMGIARIYIV
jgi:hypothetical protein